MRISIAQQFSDVPWGRIPSDGIYCGQNFRETHLVPALRDNSEVVVDLDGVEGLGSSFLDESFGALVRRGLYTHDELKKKLRIVTTNPNFAMYVDLAWRYMAGAKYRSEPCAVTAA